MRSDLRAEPMVISVPAVAKAALLLGAADRWQYFQLRLHRQPRHGQRTRATTWWSARTGRARRPPRIKKVFHSTHAVLARHLSHATLQSRRTCRTWSRSRPATRCSRSPRFSSSPRRPPAPPIDFPKVDKPSMAKTDFFEYLDFALQFAPPAPEETEIRAKLASIGIGAGKTVRLQGPLGRAQGRSPAGHEGGRRQGRQVPRQRTEGDQRLEASARSSATATFYNGDWLKRAAAAKGGIYGNDAVEAMYPLHQSDAPMAKRSMAASTTTR